METGVLKFVIVGHVDHGKSTLIGRLLFDTDSLPDGKIEEIKQFCEAMGKEIEFGYVMDHLEEERSQGITIDTAQIFFSSKRRDYVIIDAPGHVEFLKNMITGASQAEAALLIVDAEEGIKEQTKRHAYILHLLGLDQVVVVINKMDLIGYRQDRFEEIKRDLLAFLSEISISPSQVIPISAKDGDSIARHHGNMPWYHGPTVLMALDALIEHEAPSALPLRFVVQDVYNFAKRTVVGRVESGVLHTGDVVKILPSGETTTVASIEEFQKTPTEAEAGKSTGFVTKDKVFIDRGYVVVKGDQLPAMTTEVRANIFWMDKTPYHADETLLFRCVTQEVPCRISRIVRVIDSSSLETLPVRQEIRNREVAEVVIATDRPVIVEDFTANESLGRFVLERADTCAGGIVLGVE
jgi:sulfate adenylyltransferase large subunit